MSERRTSSRLLWRLSATSHVENGTAVLQLEGRLSHATAAELEVAANTLLAQSIGDLVFDLAEVEYISSSALQVIGTIAAELASRGGRLTLSNPSPAARLALELAGLAPPRRNDRAADEV